MRLTAAFARMLPLFALLVLGLTVGLSIAAAGDTFGYDFRAYHAAAVRVIEGKPLYDLTYTIAGPYGLFLYPPAFVPFILPFGLLATGPATWAWLVTLIAAFAVAVALMPVSNRTRWLVVLLAGLSWPFIYNLKLGQVGPLLFLLMAIGWRWLDRDAVLGATVALGATIKIQPGLILFWALLTRRWAAVASGAVVMIGLAAVATLLAGFGVWADFLTLITRVSDPIATPHNFTLGAVAYQVGVPREAAVLLQYASTAAALTAVVVSALRLPAVPSYLVAIISSQLLSPILWDHYAMLLLLPVAWLLDRGCWWAVVFALMAPVLLVGSIPGWIYCIAFWGCLAAVMVVGARERESRTAGGAIAGAER